MTTQNTETGAPRLADRLSALVGQASTRGDDGVTADRLLTAITSHIDATAQVLEGRIAAAEDAQRSRLDDLSREVDERLARLEAADPTGALRSHVDEVGGALVVRLDEVQSGLQEQVNGMQALVVGRVEALDEVVRTPSGTDVGAELAALREQLPTTDAFGDVAQGAQIEVLAETVAERAQAAIEHATDMREALRDELRADLAAAAAQTLEQNELVAAALLELRDALTDVERSVGARVDEAALALAETMVALLATGAPVPAAPSVWADPAPGTPPSAAAAGAPTAVAPAAGATGAQIDVDDRAADIIDGGPAAGTASAAETVTDTVTEDAAPAEDADETGDAPGDRVPDASEDIAAEPAGGEADSEPASAGEADDAAGATGPALSEELEETEADDDIDAAAGTGGAAEPQEPAAAAGDGSDGAVGGEFDYDRGVPTGGTTLTAPRRKGIFRR